MKKRLAITTLLLTAGLNAGAMAATIDVGNIKNIHVADTLLGSSSAAACDSTPNQATCDFLTPSPVVYLTSSQLAGIVTQNPASYVLSPFRNRAHIDLGFNGFNLYNGLGNDLVVFNVGNNTNFGLEVYSADGVLLSANTYNIPAGDSLTVRDDNGNWLCVGGSDNFCTGGAALSAVKIDLGDDVAPNIPIGMLRVIIGEDFNGNINGQPARPRFSLAGGFHVQAVPVPAAVWLFGSGLLALTSLARRRG